ncbi:MAG: AmmeMemoRadiSam system radical SAM enzyme, partial [Candidatus Hydrothermarchaeales archaeon]
MMVAWCYDGNTNVKCNLCVLQCEIKNGKRGFCRTRENRNGKLYNVVYGRLSSFSTDYIEKAPLYHFYPNHTFLIIGSVGCNLRCKFCLTWNITQVRPEDVKADELGIEEIVDSAKKLYCRGIVYTHSEPTLNIEFYAELMRVAKDNGLVNVFATNGFISLEAFDLISERLDAVTLTIKGTRDFYQKICGVNADFNHLPKLMEKIKEREIHLEVVYVLIPEHNDDEESLLELINLVKKSDAPLIFLRFIPSYKMDRLDSTSEERLENALNLAYKNGLKYVYLENIFSHPGKNTYCEKCKNLLIKREGYGIIEW